MDCLFCKIVHGEIKSNLVYQDDEVIAFHDIHPQAPTHILCIPRRHISTLNDLTDQDAEIAGKLLLTARRLARELGFAEEGYRLVMNCNDHGGQTVYHIHLHLLGGRPCGWPPG